jgi:hypothetical protein
VLLDDLSFEVTVSVATESPFPNLLPGNFAKRVPSLQVSVFANEQHCAQSPRAGVRADLDVIVETLREKDLEIVPAEQPRNFDLQISPGQEDLGQTRFR